MELDSTKKSRWDSVMHLKSFDMQEVREKAERKQERRDSFPSYAWE